PVTATANAGYAFTGFSGDLSGTANPQNISMTAPRSVMANFGLLTATAASALAGQYSDPVDLSATISAINSTLSSGVSGLLQFSVDGVNAAGTVAVNGAGTYTLPYTITQAKGTHTVKAVFSGATGAILSSTATNSLTVSLENATVTPSASNPIAVQVGSA